MEKTKITLSKNDRNELIKKIEEVMINQYGSGLGMTISMRSVIIDVQDDDQLLVSISGLKIRLSKTGLFELVSMNE